MKKSLDILPLYVIDQLFDMVSCSELEIISNTPVSVLPILHKRSVAVVDIEGADPSILNTKLYFLRPQSLENANIFTRKGVIPNECNGWNMNTCVQLSEENFDNIIEVYKRLLAVTDENKTQKIMTEALSDISEFKEMFVYGIHNVFDVVALALKYNGVDGIRFKNMPKDVQDAAIQSIHTSGIGKILGIPEEKKAFTKKFVQFESHSYSATENATKSTPISTLLNNSRIITALKFNNILTVEQLAERVNAGGKKALVMMGRIGSEYANIIFTQLESQGWIK